MHSALRSGAIQSTRRVREPLNFLSMQSVDKSQISTSIRTMDALIMTFYLPLTNLQQGLHRRYEAEQFAQIMLPPGVPAPPPVTRWPTQDSKRGVAAGTRGFARSVLAAPHSTGHDGATTASCSHVAAQNTAAAEANSEIGSYRSTHTADLSSVADAGATGGDPLHNDLNNRTLPTGETCVPLGLVTLLVGTIYPQSQSWLERCIDPGPHSTLSLRVAVLDRIYWQRTCWMTGCICHSLCWGRIPHHLFAIEMDYQSRVVISGAGDANASNLPDRNGAAQEADSAPSMQRQRWWWQKRQSSAPVVFDENRQRYVNGGLRVSVPEHNFHITVQDTGKTLFDEDVRVVDGFADNESALHRLALAREVNMLGLGGSVYRQPSWSTPCLPNLGTVTSCEFGSLFTKHYGCNPVGNAPVAVWMIRDVPETLIYQMEGEVEDENDPNSATTYGDRSLTERVQKKAMNRYNNFRDEIRSNVYSELGGQEMPR